MAAGFPLPVETGPGHPAVAADSAPPTLHRPLVVLAALSDPYRQLAAEISASEAAPLAATVEEAVALAPDFLIWVVSPAMLSDQALVAYGNAVRRASVPIALGFISGSSIGHARELFVRRLPARDLRIAAAYGAWQGQGHYRSRLQYLGGRVANAEPLTVESFTAALRESDALLYEGHGAPWYLRFDPTTVFNDRDVPPRSPLLVSTLSCNTFRIWESRSIALAFTDRGTAAYIGYAYSPLPGYQMTNGFPLRHTWPDFPIGRLVELQAAASMRGLFAFPVYHLLGDPRLSVRDSPPYRVVSDRQRHQDRVIDLAPQPADILPVRINGGAVYETTEVAGIGKVWRRDPFYNARLQVLDVGADRYLLLQYTGGPITIRLSNDRPMFSSAAATLLKALDLCLIVYPGADRPTGAMATAFGIVGLAWSVLRRRVRARAFLTAVAFGGAVTVAHLAYATARLGHIDAVSLTDFESWPLHGWMFTATWALAAWGSLRFVLAKRWPGKSLALVLAGLFSGWGPVIVWLGGPLVFNWMVITRIGSPLYNYRPGLLTVGGAIVFTVFLAAVFTLARRLSLPRRHPVPMPDNPLPAVRP